MNRRTGILLAAVLGSGVVFLDSSVVVLAQQAMGRELPTSVVSRLEGLSYVYYGYLLTLSALLILAGALNGLILPAGLGVILCVAARRRDLLHGYRYPAWLLAVGAAAWCVSLYVGWEALSGIDDLWH